MSCQRVTHFTNSKCHSNKRHNYTFHFRSSGWRNDSCFSFKYYFPENTVLNASVKLTTSCQHSPVYTEPGCVVYIQPKQKQTPHHRGLYSLVWKDLGTTNPNSERCLSEAERRQVNKSTTIWWFISLSWDSSRPTDRRNQGCYKRYSTESCKPLVWLHGSSHELLPLMEIESRIHGTLTWSHKRMLIL